MAFVFLDLVRGQIQQLVSEIRERPLRREFLADGGHVGIMRIAVGQPEPGQFVVPEMLRDPGLGVGLVLLERRHRLGDAVAGL